MSTRHSLRNAAPFLPDDNIASYDPAADGRNSAGERVQYIAIGRLHPSPYQTRLRVDGAADHDLGEDLDANGMIHPPLVRRSSCNADAFEIVAGHRRVLQCLRLANEGRGRHFLKPPLDGGDAAAEWRVPVLVSELDTFEALARTVAENFARSDLSPWEQARALVHQEELLEARGENASVRRVAESLSQSRGTIAPYLMVGRAITLDVRRAAGLADEKGDGAALCVLSLEALQRAARPNDVPLRAAALRTELEKAGVLPRSPREARPTDDTAGPAGGGFQINIRRSIPDLAPSQALGYLERILPATLALAERAGSEGGQVLQRAIKKWEASSNAREH